MQVHWAFLSLLGELGVLSGFLFILSRQDYYEVTGLISISDSHLFMLFVFCPG